jgi:hypothetical protein
MNKEFHTNTSRATRFGLALTVCMILGTVGQSGCAQERVSPPVTRLKELNQTETEILQSKWLKIFGPIDFSNADFFACLRYIHPQPEKVFADFDHKQFRQYFGSVARQFFKAPYSPAKSKLLPEKYYLPKRGDDPGLLWYEWKVDPYSFRMIESGNGILVRIRPKGFDAQKGIQSSELLQLLQSIFNLKIKPEQASRSPGKSEEEVMKGFRLPPVLRVSETFSNADLPRWPVGLCGAWQLHVTGFVSREGIYVMCFKSGFRASAIFPYHPDWLANCLLEPDGVTLVATGQKDAWTVEQRREAGRKALAQKLPRNPTQFAELLKDPDPEFRHSVLQRFSEAAGKSKLPTAFFDVLEKHYTTENDDQCRRDIVWEMADHPNPAKGIRFLIRAQASETDEYARELIEDSKRQLGER